MERPPVPGCKPLKSQKVLAHQAISWETVAKDNGPEGRLLPASFILDYSNSHLQALAGTHSLWEALLGCLHFTQDETSKPIVMTSLLSEAIPEGGLDGMAKGTGQPDRVSHLGAAVSVMTSASPGAFPRAPPGLAKQPGLHSQTEVPGQDLTFLAPGLPLSQSLPKTLTLACPWGDPQDPGCPYPVPCPLRALMSSRSKPVHQ